MTTETQLAALREEIYVELDPDARDISIFNAKLDAIIAKVQAAMVRIRRIHCE